MLGGSSEIFLIISLVSLVILGGVLEGLPALLVTVPLLMPIAIQSGINPVHYAIVLIFAMGMGCFIPPFGIGFYVSCSIGECSTEKVTPRLVPYVLVLTAGLLMVTFIPWFSLMLPRLFHLTR
jgi:TRAP-type C4-dicarboxylate transport system permease large subunit